MFENNGDREAVRRSQTLAFNSCFAVWVRDRSVEAVEPLGFGWGALSSLARRPLFLTST